MTVREAARRPMGSLLLAIRAFFTTPCWLASTDGPAKSSGDEHRRGLAGHQPAPCRTAAPRTIST